MLVFQINREREGEQIDRALLKNVLGIYVEIGMGQMESYEKDFEEYMLNDTAAYYRIKASDWIMQDSCPDYMLKVNNSIKALTTIIIALIFHHRLCLYYLIIY